jgi:hypothetical protein
METDEKPNMRAKSREEASRAASMLGSITTEKKAGTSRANLEKANAALAARGGARKTPRPIESFECTCGRGDTLEGHPTTCPRGLVIYRRKKQGKL